MTETEFGGHIGRHLELLILLKDAKVALIGFSKYRFLANFLRQKNVIIPYVTLVAEIGVYLLDYGDVKL